MEYATLANGIKMPLLGFGVFQIPDNEVCKKVVKDALEVGYRMIDTALAYFNEEGVFCEYQSEAQTERANSKRNKQGK